VPVSLGVDWNASGSDTLFDELRVAAGVNEEQWAGAIPTSAWVPMITSNPVKALAADALVGSLEVGKKADITALRARAGEPGASVLANYLGDVEGVWIGGQLLYGTAAVIETVRPKACEQLLVQGSAKRVCTPALPLVVTLGKRFPYLVPVAR
jgi:cytosine/adenosine deaminase-related metal-dependent hydrolase